MTTSPYTHPTLSVGALDERDQLEQLTLADHADWMLLRLVSCTALATLLLATAISLAR